MGFETWTVNLDPHQIVFKANRDTEYAISTSPHSVFTLLQTNTYISPCL